MFVKLKTSSKHDTKRCVGIVTLYLNLEFRYHERSKSMLINMRIKYEKSVEYRTYKLWSDTPRDIKSIPSYPQLQNHMYTFGT